LLKTSKSISYKNYNAIYHWNIFNLTADPPTLFFYIKDFDSNTSPSPPPISGSPKSEVGPVLPYFTTGCEVGIPIIMFF
jgi:hypothetical protein